MLQVGLLGEHGREYGDRARIIRGDGTATGLPDAEFGSVVCFTMLHHVPTPVLQDRLFTEAFRVLQRGGVFAGSDGVPSLAFRLAHIADTCNPGRRTRCPTGCAVGFTEVQVDVAGGEQRWKAVKPWRSKP